jgi:hypothetical protein
MAPAWLSSSPSRTISGNRGVKAKRPMPIATASDASAATHTAAAMRPGLAAVEIVVLSMPVF